MKNNILNFYAVQECDIIMAAIMPSSERLQVLDFIHPWLYTSAAFLVPLPEILANNVDAITKPFQPWVSLPYFHERT